MPDSSQRDDEACMREAIAEAAAATSEGKMPFGAVLAIDSVIVARAHNQCPAAAKRGGGTGDVTRHAEMELVRLFTSKLTAEERSNAVLYTSTEPCVMCAGAIYWSGVSKVVYGCSARQLEALSGPGGFDIPVDTLYGMASKGARRMECLGPLLAEESLQVHVDSGVWKNAPVPTTAEFPPVTQADLDIAVEAALLKSGLGSAKVVDDGVVPVIDLSVGTDEQVAEKLWQAATEVGFFCVVGHGIDQSIIDGAFGASETFFAQPLEDKKAQSPLDMSINSGFEYFAQVRPSTGVADQKESLQITARQGCMDDRWPSDEFHKSADALLEASHQLAKRILNLLQPQAIPHVEPETLANSHTLWEEDGQCTLRFLHYPPLDSDTTAKLIDDGYWRAGPHTDWDNVTLLYQQMGQNGLECCANPRTGDPASMYWTAVNPVEGGIAINVGDMLARWSDGKLFSNLHRVRLPPDASKSRYSIAFFAQSDKKALIESKESEPITAGDYILSRIRSNFDKK
jgi:isopenicillin N synthase-like dioxygenase/tRNA(Arg) A34 adenosine deaminase TadA